MKSQAIHDFIYWLEEEKEFRLDNKFSKLTDLVAEFFEIDLKKFNAEKDTMYREMVKGAKNKKAGP